MIRPLPMSSAFSPKRRAWRTMIQYAPARPTAYAMPYQYRASGPSWIAIEPGVQSIIAAECTRDPRPVRPYPSGHMAEFQWWLLLVGLAAGGGLVAVVSMDARRREEDLAELERRAEATWIADPLGPRGGAPDAATAAAVAPAPPPHPRPPPPGPP